MLILGIETSCDETAAAVVKSGRTVVSSIVASQTDIHTVYGGVVPEIASRAHTEAISGIVNQALKSAELSLEDIDGIAVTQSPGLIGALLVGLSFAKGLSFASDKPLIPVHHIRGHVAANYLAFPELQPPFVALVVSGGHTSLLLVKDYTEFELIGQTRDDAAGEAFDKAARVLGLPYPGGAVIDKLATKGNKKAYRFPVSKIEGSEFDFSFSGLKTALINQVHNHREKTKKPLTDSFVENIAASYTDAIVKTILSRLELLPEKYGSYPIVLGGGVAANSHLRAAVADYCKRHNVTLFAPPLSLCGDNATMIASQGYYEYVAGNIAPLSLNAYATKKV